MGVRGRALRVDYEEPRSYDGVAYGWEGSTGGKGVSPDKNRPGSAALDPRNERARSSHGSG